MAEAARRVGMGRETAWRLRGRAGAGSFAHAWDAVVALRRGERLPHRKVTLAELPEHALEGPYVVHMRRCRFLQARREPSTSALLRHIRRLDAAALRGGWEL